MPKGYCNRFKYHIDICDNKDKKLIYCSWDSSNVLNYTRKDFDGSEIHNDKYVFYMEDFLYGNIKDIDHVVYIYCEEYDSLVIGNVRNLNEIRSLITDKTLTHNSIDGNVFRIGLNNYKTYCKLKMLL